MNKILTSDVLTIEQIIKVITLSDQSKEKSVIANFCDILITQDDIDFWFIYDNGTNKKQYNFTGLQIGIVLCAIEKYYDEFSWDDRGVLASNILNDMHIGKYRLIKKSIKLYLDIPIGLVNTKRSSLEKLLVDNSFPIPDSWDLKNTKNLDFNPQKQFNVKRHDEFRKSRDICVAEADEMWKKEVAENSKITRMGEMAEKLSNKLINKKFKSPMLASTIRTWLSNAEKSNKLTIPAEARKSGAPKK